MKGTFSFPPGAFGENVTTFGADMSSSVNVDNKKKINSWWKSYTKIRWYITAGRKKSIQLILQTVRKGSL